LIVRGCETYCFTRIECIWLKAQQAPVVV
jgi:hypothetical protein